MNSEKVGRKIRNFRMRAGLSQLDLEIEIGNSSGSISRIENGTTNPTKETILKIASVFDLNAVETASLFDIELSGLTRANIDAYSKDITRELITERVLKHFIAEKLSEIEKKLDYVGATLSLVDINKSTIRLSYFSGTMLGRLAQSVITRGKLFGTLELHEKKTMTKTKLAAIKRKTIIGTKIVEFTVPPLSRWQAWLFQFIGRIKEMIAIPVISPESRVIGVAILASRATITKSEVEALENFCSYFGKILGVILAKAKE